MKTIIGSLVLLGLLGVTTSANKLVGGVPKGRLDMRIADTKAVIKKLKVAVKPDKPKAFVQPDLSVTKVVKKHISKVGYKKRFGAEAIAQLVADRKEEARQIKIASLKAKAAADIETSIRAQLVIAEAAVIKDHKPTTKAKAVKAAKAIVNNLEIAKHDQKVDSKAKRSEITKMDTKMKIAKVAEEVIIAKMDKKNKPAEKVAKAKIDKLSKPA